MGQVEWIDQCSPALRIWTGGKGKAGKGWRELGGNEGPEKAALDGIEACWLMAGNWNSVDQTPDFA